MTLSNSNSGDHRPTNGFDRRLPDGRVERFYVYARPVFSNGRKGKWSHHTYHTPWFMSVSGGDEWRLYEDFLDSGIRTDVIIKLNRGGVA